MLKRLLAWVAKPFSPDISELGEEAGAFGPRVQPSRDDIRALRIRSIRRITDLMERVGSDAALIQLAVDTGINQDRLRLLVQKQRARRLHFVIPWAVQSWRWLFFVLPGRVERLGGPASDRSLWRWTWIERSESQVLRANEIHSIDELWSRIGSDFDAGIQQVTSDTFLEPGRLADLLVAQGAREVGWAGNQRFSLLLTNSSLFLVAVALVTFVVFESRLVSPPGLGGSVTPQVIAQTRASLPPLHVISSDDIAVRLAPPREGSYSNPDMVVGRITRASIPAGAPLDAKDLFTPCRPAGSGANTQTKPPELGVLALAVRAAVVATSTPGDCADLVLTPRDRAGVGTSPSLFPGVTVLAINRSSDLAGIVVAISLTDEPVLAKLLGTSDVYFVHRSRD